MGHAAWQRDSALAAAAASSSSSAAATGLPEASEPAIVASAASASLASATLSLEAQLSTWLALAVAHPELRLDSSEVAAFAGTPALQAASSSAGLAAQQAAQAAQAAQALGRQAVPPPPLLSAPWHSSFAATVLRRLQELRSLEEEQQDRMGAALGGRLFF